MLATSRDFESWRRPAAITSSWEWFSTMAEGRSPSATVLLLRQCLACGRDSNFRGLGAQWIRVKASGCDRLDKWASSFLDVIRIQGESAPGKRSIRECREFR